MPTIGKINRAPEKPAFDLSDYEWLIEQWLADCARRSRAETVRGYRQKTNYFRDWWAKVGPVHNWLISEVIFQEFEVHLRNHRSWLRKPLAYHTRRDAISRCGEMLRWAYNAEIISYDVGKWLPTAQGSPPVRHAATLEQLQRLFDAAGRTNWPERSRAILALLLGAGLRRKESVAVESDDSGYADGVYADRDVDEKALTGLLIEKINFYADHSGLLNVVGKRTAANPSGIRQVAFDPVVGKYLLAYLDDLGETRGPFLRHARFKERPVGHRGVYYVVKEMIALAGLEDVIDACHQLRRNYSHYWVKLMDSPLGADMLRRNLGHKQFKQTTEYTMVDASDIVPHATSPLSMFEKKEKP